MRAEEEAVAARQVRRERERERCAYAAGVGEDKQQVSKARECKQARERERAHVRLLVETGVPNAARLDCRPSRAAVSQADWQKRRAAA